MNMYVPIVIIVLSNIFYHICSKSTPDSIDPFASLTITYLVGAVFSGIMFYALNRGGNLLGEYKHANWSTFVLGLAIVGLEVGSIYMYKTGWNISIGHLVHSSILSICLVIIGVLVYKEQVTFTQIAVIVICSVGLYMISK